jgi:transposase
LILVANPLVRDAKSDKVCYNSENSMKGSCSHHCSRRERMSLKPEEIGPIPEETARVARTAYPKGNVFMRMRDELGTMYQDEAFAPLFSHTGQPAEAPWRLALVTVMQFAEGLSDRQAADAVRGRIDFKYALGLELSDPGFDHTVLAEFRARLIAGNAEQLLLDTMLTLFKQRGWLKARGKQRTDSTHVQDIHPRAQSGAVRGRNSAPCLKLSSDSRTRLAAGSQPA